MNKLIRILSIFYLLLLCNCESYECRLNIRYEWIYREVTGDCNFDYFEKIKGITGNTEGCVLYTKPSIDCSSVSYHEKCPDGEEFGTLYRNPEGIYSGIFYITGEDDCISLAIVNLYPLDGKMEE